MQRLNKWLIIWLVIWLPLILSVALRDPIAAVPAIGLAHGIWWLVSRSVRLLRVKNQRQVGGTWFRDILRQTNWWLVGWFILWSPLIMLGATAGGPFGLIALIGIAHALWWTGTALIRAIRKFIKPVTTKQAPASQQPLQPIHNAPLLLPSPVRYNMIVDFEQTAGRQNTISDNSIMLAERILPNDRSYDTPMGMYSSFNTDHQELNTRETEVVDYSDTVEEIFIDTSTLIDEGQPSSGEVEFIPTPPEPTGVVYLLKAGPFYKIGKASNFDRRLKQIKLQLPYPVEVIHTIKAYDITGIERYWHKKYANRRTNGEWFVLTDEEVDEFRSHIVM